MLALDSRVINLTDGPAGGYKYAKVGVTIELRPAAASFYDLHGTERAKEEKTETDKIARTFRSCSTPSVRSSRRTTRARCPRPMVGPSSRTSCSRRCARSSVTARSSTSTSPTS
jgi:hypothetical protein